MALWLCVYATALLCHCQDLDMGGDPEEAGADEFENLMEKDATAWWNEDWARRQPGRLEIVNPHDIPGRVLFLKEPKPLFLANTLRAQRGMADLRIIDEQGKSLPCGAINWDRDDGSHWIWAQLTKAPEQGPMRLFLYYSNPKAKPLGAKLPRVPVPEQPSSAYRVELAFEEVRPRDPPASRNFGPGEWFERFICIECEELDGITRANRRHLVRGQKGASADYCVINQALRTGERIEVPLTREIAVPADGTYRLWVRYLPRLRKQEFEPFTIGLGEAGRSRRFGAAIDKSESFVWEWQDLDLKKGTTTLSLELPGVSAPDCILLTRDKEYRPDIEEFSGPVWMRFKVLEPKENRYSVRAYCVHTPYSAMGQLGTGIGTLFRRGAIARRPDIDAAAKDETQLIPAGEYTPWVQALHSRAYTWYTRVTFERRAGEAEMKKIKVQADLATAPHPDRIFRTATERTGLGPELLVRMPTGLSWRSMDLTQTFGQWAERRFEHAKAMGFRGGEGPKKILFLVWADSMYTERVLDMTLKTFSWIGLNGICSRGPDDEALGRYCEKHGIKWTFYNHWAMPIGIGAALSDAPMKATYLETVNEIYRQQLDEFYERTSKTYKERYPWYFSHCRYNSMGDEIGPAISPEAMNENPRLRGLYHEYLKQQGVTPEFVGAETWDKVRAPAELVIRVKQPWDIRREMAEEAERKTAEEAKKLGAGGLNTPDQVEEDEEEKSEDEKVMAKLTEEEEAEPETEEERAKRELDERRSYYWMTRFQSYFTANIFYPNATAAFNRYYPKDAVTTCNLQASPAQTGAMWGGALNVFELGRAKAFEAMHVEDYVGGSDRGTGQVLYAAGLLRAAARKHSLPLGCYLCGAYVRTRTIAFLAQGTHFINYYIYGPIHCIGPVWSENYGHIEDMGRTLREIARVEDYLVKARNKKSEAAMLVANSSEAMSRFHKFPFASARQNLFIALNQAQVPVDIVGEEDIVTDGLLDSYKALYVVDPNVRMSVQERIRDWVQAGGWLRLSAGACAWNEYHEPSSALDKALGVNNRAAKPLETDAPEPPAQVGLSATEVTPEGSVRAAGVRETAVPSTAEELAKFADGAPAVLRNRFGRGRTMLTCFSPEFGYWGHWSKKGEDGASTERELIAKFARAAGAEPHCKLSRHGIYNLVHEGPGVKVLFLMNVWLGHIERLGVEIPFDTKPAKVISSRKGAVPFDYRDGAVHFSLPIDLTDIVVVAAE